MRNAPGRLTPALTLLRAAGHPDADLAMPERTGGTGWFH
jgi:hypothetical protein